MRKGKIILLNGVSSSGKSTLSKELMKQMGDFFHLSIDDYDGFIVKAEDRKHGHLIPVPTESFYHRTVAMFSDFGQNVVADQILHDSATAEDCLEVLKDYPVFFVGVHCPLSVLEQREKERGDRPAGLAKKQIEETHRLQHLYHLEVDTQSSSIPECAAKIQHALLEHDFSQAWVTPAYKSTQL